MVWMRIHSLVVQVVILSALFVACTPAPTPQGPVLVNEVTLGPTEIVPTRFLSPTPRRITPEVVSPLNNVTVDAQFVIVTPTLPPSKTPTETPTFTPTPSTTPSPTMTNTATATAFLLPTSEIIAITRPAALPNDRICDSNWFFIEPRPANCPLYPPNASAGVYQEFENGYMVWVGNQDAIYVLYSDLTQPRWEVYRDFFNEGMAEESSIYAFSPSPVLWQPRRGFGLLWRDNAAVRNRIGWATQEWEQPYSVQVQTGDNGTIFLDTPRTSIFGLFPDGISWSRYAGTAASTTTSISPSVPLPTVLPSGL